MPGPDPHGPPIHTAKDAGSAPPLNPSAVTPVAVNCRLTPVASTAAAVVGIAHRLDQYRGPRHSRTPPASKNMLASMRSA